MTIPLDATYRVQFRQGMTFERAAAIVPYLENLGVSHLYASPIFAAASGSTHGYDVTDPDLIDPTLGGAEDFKALCDRLHERGLGMIVDIVPNHMAASTENPWWASVLEWGEQSPYAGHFDIDWTAGPLTLPFLGSTFEQCLDQGELSIGFDDTGRIVLKYYDNWFPLDPRTCSILFDRMEGVDCSAARRAAADADPADPSAFRQALRELVGQSDFAAAADNVAQERSLVEALHAAQAWRLYEWREGRTHLTYRRFFEITGLVGVRVEDEKVFDDVHRTILDLVGKGYVDGLRIDHVDGLADPAGYLKRLREAVGPEVPIHVEKILEAGERLPADWPVEGTTGYEFIAALARVFTDGDEAEAFDDIYRRVLGERPDYKADLLKAKTEIVTWNLEGELDLLTRKASELATTLGADLAGEALIRDTLVAALTAFPVYRTYVDAEGVNAEDAELLDEVESRLRIDAAAGKPQEAVGFLFRLLRLDVPAEARAEALSFAVRFQQTSGPVMAKAVEDTLFYRSSRLIALNEVGGDPEAITGSAAVFHTLMAERLRTQPRGLSTTATHDTKRGEDARARLYTLGEAPEIWGDAVSRWRSLHAGLRAELPDGPAPEPETEWMLYQALLGAWPVDTESDGWLEELGPRFLAFVEKAMREDKRRTRWTEINEPYESAVKTYAERLVDPDNTAFLDDFAAKAAPFVAAGIVNSFAQTILKITAPGIPDVYNGSEAWDLSFVDPDNRRPVDFDNLPRLLERHTPWPARGEDMRDGTVKQHLVAAALKGRKSRRDLFARGSYEPVAVEGDKARHVIAFARIHGSDRALIVLPRLVLDLFDGGAAIAPDIWKNTRLDLGDEWKALGFTNVLTGESIAGKYLGDIATALSSTSAGFFLSE